MLLYNALHCSKHCWTHGLKTAYDAAWICRRFPTLNWNYLARLVTRTGLNRGFWVPMRLLARALELPIPRAFLARAPDDARQRKLERIAQSPLFGANNQTFVENGWVYHAIFLLQSDSWPHRARYLVGTALGAEAVQGRRLSAHRNSKHRGARWKKLARAAGSWRGL